MITRKTIAAGFVAAATGIAICGSALAADIALISGKPDDTFFQPVKLGVDDARFVVEATGGTVTYLPLSNYDNLGPDAANLIRTAVGQGADGIVIANWVPDSMDAAITEAIEAGVTVMIYNSGNLEMARELGALNYIGSDEYEAGLAAGHYFQERGYNNILCVNTIPGSLPLETRCNAVKEAVTPKGGTSRQLPLPASQGDNAASVSQAVKAALLTNPEIDAILTLNPAVADWAASGIMQAGKTGTVPLGTFDMNEEGLNRIAAGTQLFAIDQQPYLQSFLSVTLLNSYLEYGLNLPTAPVLTGPGFVDSSNIEATMSGVKKGKR